MMLSLLLLYSTWILLQIPTTAFLSIPRIKTYHALKGSSSTNEVSNVVLGLEKRLKDGSLSKDETDTVIGSLDTVVDALESHLKEEDRVSDSENVNVVDNTVLYEYDNADLKAAVSEFDAEKVTSMLNSGMKMDDETVESLFWGVVNQVEKAEQEDKALSGDIPRMIHHMLDADMHLLLNTRDHDQIRTNVTCMQPDDSGGLKAAARRMNYVFDDGDHKNLPLKEGRKCEGGNCCDKCSRNIFPTFALQHEVDLGRFSGIQSLTFNDLEKVDNASILQFVRLVERVRRTIAHEYGVPLKTILPLQAYSRKYVAGTTQKGGGGGEGDFVILHTDEATHDGYHYSCVLYLSNYGEDFEGGAFVFNDPANEDTPKPKEEEVDDDEDDDDDALLQAFRDGELPDTDEIFMNAEDSQTQNYASLEDEIRRAGRELKPYHPTKGSAVIFSSGWENMHEVEKITSGTRYAVPCFFTTCPVPDMAYQQMNVGKPECDEDIADDWLHLLLAHREEEPINSVGRVKELLMKWHFMCTPLNMH